MPELDKQTDLLDWYCLRCSLIEPAAGASSVILGTGRAKHKRRSAAKIRQRDLLSSPAASGVAEIVPASLRFSSNAVAAAAAAASPKAAIEKAEEAATRSVIAPRP